MDAIPNTPRYQARRRCIADIIDAIDGVLESKGHIDMQAIQDYMSKVFSDNINELENEDILGIDQYVSDYIEVLISKKGANISKFVPRKGTYNKQDPYQLDWDRIFTLQ